MHETTEHKAKHLQYPDGFFKIQCMLNKPKVALAAESTKGNT